MAAVTCSDCACPAVRSCVCAFPLPLFCEEHRLDHSAESHFPLPLNALRHVRNVETQMELKDRVSKLRRLLTTIDLYNNSQQQITLDIRDLLMKFYKDVEELKAEVNKLKAESVRGEEIKDERTQEGTGDVLSALIWSEMCPENELGTWISIGHGLSLKTGFQYEESCRVLEDRWKLVQLNKGVGVLVLSLILSEVMGLQVGRFEEALAILEKSLQVANELYPKSEIALQLANMKTAILINYVSFEDCLDFCNETVINFRDAPTSEVSFGTALYFSMIAYLSYGRIPESGIISLREKWAKKTKNSGNSLIEHIQLYLNASLKMLGCGCRKAEAKKLIKKAGELAKRDFPTSIYAVLYSFVTFVAVCQNNEYKDTYYLLDDECLRVYFPASLLRVAILERKAQLYRMGKRDKKIKACLSMPQLQQRSLDCASLTHNVLWILEICSGDDQEALDLRESAYRILFEHPFANPVFSSLQSSLCGNYQNLKSPEKELGLYAEVIRKLQATNPTNMLLFDVLSTLTNWREGSQRDTAIQMCADLYQFLREKYPHSENYFSAVKAMRMIYKDLHQQEKLEEILLEGVQIAKTFYKFKHYVYFIYMLASDLQRKQFSVKRKLEISTEMCDLLISNPSSDCSLTSPHIKEVFCDQPEMLLKIFLAVFHTLLASPTEPALKEYLDALIRLYRGTDQSDKEIEIRLEANQRLLDHITCEFFLSTQRALQPSIGAGTREKKQFSFKWK